MAKWVKNERGHEDRLLFESTGRTLSFNRRIIGLNPEMGEVFEGYDGGYSQDEWAREDGQSSVLSPEERVELADYMIALWTRFKEQP